MNQNVSHFIDYNNTKIPAVNIINSYWSSVVLEVHFLGEEEEERSGHGHETFQIWWFSVLAFYNIMIFEFTI